MSSNVSSNVSGDVSSAPTDAPADGVTDAALADALADARALPDDDVLPALEALLARAAATRPADAPALGPLWDAAAQAADGSADERDYLRVADGRARYLAATRGPADPQTIRALAELAEAADEACAWEIAIRAWTQIAAAPPSDDDDDAQAALSAALRGLAARQLAAGQLADAGRLLERELQVSERLHGGAHVKVALTLGDLASVRERLGALADARALRTRQRDVLRAAGAPAGVIARVEADLRRLPPA